MEPLDSSREAAQDCSPGRKPWVKVGNEQAPQGRKTDSHAHTSGLYATVRPHFEVSSRALPGR